MAGAWTTEDILKLGKGPLNPGKYTGGQNTLPVVRPVTSVYGSGGAGTASSAVQAMPTAREAAAKGKDYSDGSGKTDWSKLIHEELSKGSGADAGVLQGYLDARNQKITQDPSLAKYANDATAQAARAYIEAANRQKNQAFTWNSIDQMKAQSGYDAAQKAQEAYIKGQVQKTVDGLNAQKAGVMQSAEEAAKQAYISYMQSRNTLPQALAASGYAGGMADSQRLALETNLQNNQQGILQNRDNAINDINTAVNNAKLEGSIQGAQAQAELARDAIAAWQNYVNAQNSQANADYWTKYGYDFQAAQNAADREYQTAATAQNQAWQAQQTQLEREFQAQQQKATQGQDMALQTAMEWLAAGIVPDAGILERAGITLADAQAYAAYAKQQAAQKSSAVRNTGSTGSKSTGTTLTDAESKFTAGDHSDAVIAALLGEGYTQENILASGYTGDYFARAGQVGVPLAGMDGALFNTLYQNVGNAIKGDPERAWRLLGQHKRELSEEQAAQMKRLFAQYGYNWEG